MGGDFFSAGKLVASQYVYAPVVGMWVCGLNMVVTTSQGFLIRNLMDLPTDGVISDMKV